MIFPLVSLFSAIIFGGFIAKNQSYQKAFLPLTLAFLICNESLLNISSVHNPFLHSLKLGRLQCSNSLFNHDLHCVRASPSADVWDVRWNRIPHQRNCYFWISELFRWSVRKPAVQTYRYDLPIINEDHLQWYGWSASHFRFLHFHVTHCDDSVQMWRCSDWTYKNQKRWRTQKSSLIKFSLKIQE